MTDKTTFLHLTDLHISAPELGDASLRSDTLATLAAVRSLVEAMASPPAFIVATGDLTNHGDAASYRTLREAMDGIGIPVVYALGNHDTRRGFYDVMLGGADDPDAPYDHDVVHAGVHVIALDSSVPGRIGGDLDEAQFAFLDDALDRHPDLPKILAIHHAPALERDPDWEWEGLSFAATDRLAAMLSDRPVAGIFSGHIHQDRFTHWYGTPLVVGMGQHCALDPLFSGDGIRSVAGTSFSVCTLRPSGLTVTCVPFPSDRREVSRATLADLRAYEEARAKALALS